MLAIVGQIGLVLYMFLVGLEVDQGAVRRGGRAVAAVAMAATVVPLLVGLALAPVLEGGTFVGPGSGGSPPSHLGFRLMVGAMLAVTAFPVMARILEERRLSTTPLGTTGIAAAAAVSVLMFLAVAGAKDVAEGHGVGTIVQRWAGVALYLAVIGGVLRPALVPWGRRLEARGRLGDSGFALILVLVLVASVAADRLGINVIPGAFLVGAVLPARDLLRAELGGRLREITVVVLLPVFLAFSGLNTDFTALGWASIGGLVLLLVAAVAGKWLGGALGARLGGLRGGDVHAMGVLMNCRGLLVLVVGLVALQSGVISPALQVGGVLMALVTTVMTAPLLERFLPERVHQTVPQTGERSMVVRYKWDGEDARVARLQADLEASREKAIEHPLYRSLTSVDRVRTFMSLHVFAVWDFMSLLKALQQRLTCVEVPWVPRGDGLCRRLINDIVLVEESDECGDVVLSHFELYRRAMEQAGADTAYIGRFLAALDATGTGDVLTALRSADLPEAADQFVRSTWRVVDQGATHELAAVFAFGRESLIPSMFTHVLEGEHCVPLLVDYLERHVEVDEEEHTPMAVQMVLELCGDDPQRWDSARAAVLGALDARRRLWDGIVARLPAEAAEAAEAVDGPGSNGGNGGNARDRAAEPVRVGT
jgi:Kef-type K+ transport system membrane component KefB